MNAREVQAFFERVAADWDTMRLAYYDERVIERMAAVSGLNRGMTVADVGTGTGFVAAGIAPRVRRVIGIDNVPAMLEVARENLRALGVSNVELMVGDAARLPWRTARWTPPSPTWFSTTPRIRQPCFGRWPAPRGWVAR